MSSNFILGIQKNNIPDVSIEQLAPNNYLTIVWKDNQGKYVNTLDIDNKSAIEYTNRLNSAIEQGINNNNIKYVAQNKYINLESIGRYIAQEAIPKSTQREIANGLIEIVSNVGQNTTDRVSNLLINAFGGITDNVARNLGLEDPHEIFSQITGENMLGVFGELGKQTQDWIDNTISKFSKKQRNKNNTVESNTEKKYIGLILGLTTSDAESMEVVIPKRKTEDGTNYTTHLLPQDFKKDFSVMLTNKILTADYNRSDEISAIEFTKNKLFEIAKSHTLFDIYIRLSDSHMYKKSNVSFTSLNIEKDETSGNGYRATFSISPVSNFTTKYFTSNKNFNKKTGVSKGSNTSAKQKPITSDGKYVDVYTDAKSKPSIMTEQEAIELGRSKDSKDAVVKITKVQTDKKNYMSNQITVWKRMSKTEVEKDIKKKMKNSFFKKNTFYGTTAVDGTVTLTNDIGTTYIYYTTPSK